MGLLATWAAEEEKYSLKHILKTASQILGVEVKFAENCIGEPAQTAAKNLKPGEVLLLENLRFHAEEEAALGHHRPRQPETPAPRARSASRRTRPLRT